MKINIVLASLSQPGDEGLGLLPHQQTPHAETGTQLARYLKGIRVEESWVEALSKRRSAHQPHLLYRLCLLDRGVSVGDKVVLKKKILSTSDTKQRAICAGCSYMENTHKKITGKVLALVELKNPACCLTYDELTHILADSGMTQQIHVLRDEREYLIAGPARGTVIRIVDSEILLDRIYVSMPLGPVPDSR